MFNSKRCVALAVLGMWGGVASAQYPGIRDPSFYPPPPQLIEHQPVVVFHTGGTVIQTGRDVIHSSAYDPYRDYVDGGSMGYIVLSAALPPAWQPRVVANSAIVFQL